MRIGNLGSTWPTSVPDSATCGVNPCDWLDNTGSVIGESSDACAAFMKCALPNDPTTIALNGSLISGASAAVGQDTGAIIGDVASNVTTGFTSGITTSTTIPGWLLIAGLVLGGLIVLKELR